MQLTNGIEIWLPVVGFEGLYEVSDAGNVRSVPSATRYRPNVSVVLKQALTKYGYLVVILIRNKCRFYKRVNRLVAEAFHPNPLNKPCVKHIIGIKTDNYAINLEWVTYSENERHSYDVLKKNLKGVKKTFQDGINPKCKRVFCFEKNITFNSVKDAAISLKLERANITAQIKGRLTHTGGFTFRFD